MNAVATARTALKTPYELLRLPSLLVQHHYLGKLPVENPARLGVEKVLGTIDVIAGRALGDSDIVERGTDLLDRSSAIADSEIAFADLEPASTSALMPEIPPAAPAAVKAAEQNADPEPTMTEVPTAPAKVEAAKKAIEAVHEASKD